MEECMAEFVKKKIKLPKGVLDKEPELEVTIRVPVIEDFFPKDEILKAVESSKKITKTEAEMHRLLAYELKQRLSKMSLYDTACILFKKCLIEPKIDIQEMATDYEIDIWKVLIHEIMKTSHIGVVNG
jgi:hypothetical protein